MKTHGVGITSTADGVHVLDSAGRVLRWDGTAWLVLPRLPDVHSEAWEGILAAEKTLTWPAHREDKAA